LRLPIGFRKTSDPSLPFRTPGTVNIGRKGVTDTFGLPGSERRNQESLMTPDDQNRKSLPQRPSLSVEPLQKEEPKPNVPGEQNPPAPEAGRITLPRVSRHPERPPDDQSRAGPADFTDWNTLR
jgi:hypothetical protein